MNTAYALAADYIDRGFCKGVLAENVAGKPCGVDDPDAVAWCAIGALGKATITLGLSDAEDWALTRGLRDHLGVVNVSDWNDAEERTAGDVSSTLRRLAA